MMASVCMHDCRCLDKADDEPRLIAPLKPLPPVTAPVQASKAKKDSCRVEVPPKLVFSMLKDRELTSKLRALRLSTDGKRQVGAASSQCHPYAVSCPEVMPNLSRAWRSSLRLAEEVCAVHGDTLPWKVMGLSGA